MLNVFQFENAKPVRFISKVGVAFSLLVTVSSHFSPGSCRATYRKHECLCHVFDLSPSRPVTRKTVSMFSSFLIFFPLDEKRKVQFSVLRGKSLKYENSTKSPFRRKREGTTNTCRSLKWFRVLAIILSFLPAFALAGQRG